MHLNRSFHLPDLRFLTAVAALALLSACGGGGGGGDGGPPPGGGGGGTASGTLWHTGLQADGDGVKTSALDLSSSSRRIEDSREVVPTIDGGRYTVSVYNSSTNRTDIYVKDTATRNVLHQFSNGVAGYVTNVRPSPTVAQRVLVTWASSPTIADQEEVVLDMQASTAIVETLGDASTVSNWLPDGRYVVLQADGSLAIGTAGTPSSRAAVGRVAVDGGRKPAGVWPSPLGDQLLTQWNVAVGQQLNKDLWISRLDGSALERFTNRAESGNAVWSFDGKFIAWRDLKEDANCTGQSCGSGFCSSLYAEATRRSIPLDDSNVKQFRARDVPGTTTLTLGCTAVGWTR